MLDENRAEMMYVVTVVKRAGNLGRIARLRVDNKGAEPFTLAFWEWPTGRPTEAQLADMAAKLTDEVTADVLTRWGLQGDLLA